MCNKNTNDKNKVNKITKDERDAWNLFQPQAEILRSAYTVHPKCASSYLPLDNTARIVSESFSTSMHAEEQK
jgi:hypothetical protein